MLAATLAFLALGAGVLSVGHAHPTDSGLEDHSCVVCQIQHSTILPFSVADVQPVAAPEVDALVLESQFADSLACLLVPPLRGPPAA